MTVADELFAAYYKMETVEHFARISLVARQLGRERLLSREEVGRLQTLRDRYGIAAPAPLCSPESGDQLDVACQTLEAPSLPGQRLVDPEAVATGRITPVSGQLGDRDEVRLTYRQLTALIADAVTHLR